MLSIKPIGLHAVFQASKAYVDQAKTHNEHVYQAHWASWLWEIIWFMNMFGYAWNQARWLSSGVLDITYFQKQKLAPAGGMGSPLVEFISYMSKQYGDNPILGEEFMKTLVDSRWSKTTLHPFVKVALTVTNCTSMKIVDGVAKLITKTDLLALKAKKFEHVLNEMESSLGYLWKTLTDMPELDRFEKYKVFSKHCIRFSLLITNKQKQGREGKVYNMEEIKAMMDIDLKSPVTASSLPSSGSSVKPEVETQEAEALDISQANSSMFMATKLLGLKIGNSYTVKDQGSSRVWVLHEMSEKEVTLVHVPLLEPTKKLTMKFKENEIVDNLKQTKAKLPSLLAATTLDALIPSNNEMCTLESQKAEVFLALVNAYNQWDLDSTDILLQDVPHHAVYAQHDMKKGFVQLVPYPEKMSNIVMKEPSGSSAKYGVVRYMGNTFYIMGPKNYKLDGGKVDGIFAPFWTCLKEDTGGSLEEKFKQFATENGTCEIQILTNTESVAKHDQLMLKASESGTKKRKVK